MLTSSRPMKKKIRRGGSQVLTAKWVLSGRVFRREVKRHPQPPENCSRPARRLGLSRAFLAEENEAPRGGRKKMHGLPFGMSRALEPDFKFFFEIFFLGDVAAGRGQSKAGPGKTGDDARGKKRGAFF